MTTRYYHNRPYTIVGNVASSPVFGKDDNGKPITTIYTDDYVADHFVLIDEESNLYYVNTQYRKFNPDKHSLPSVSTYTPPKPGEITIQRLSHANEYVVNVTEEELSSLFTEVKDE